MGKSKDLKQVALADLTWIFESDIIVGENCGTGARTRLAEVLGPALREDDGLCPLNECKVLPIESPGSQNNLDIRIKTWVERKDHCESSV